MEADREFAEGASQDAEAALGETAPRADEPLQGEQLMVVVSLMGNALSELSNGQITVGTEEGDNVIPVAPVKGTVEQIPPDIWKLLVTTAAFMRSAVESGIQAAAPYADIPVAELATSNAGLTDLAAMFEAIAGDEQLVRAVQQFQGAPVGAGATPPEGPPSAGGPEGGGAPTPPPSPGGQRGETFVR